MKLHRFRYSPYARAVQMTLDLARCRYELIEVAYGDRGVLASKTGGYIHMPVLEDDDGSVLTESRNIAEILVRRFPELVPSPWQGPIWAYWDFAAGPLEDLLFRIASPGVRDAWPSDWERALYVLVKERKFGAGCVDAWERDRDRLIADARKLVGPTLTTLVAQPFLFGDKPTLADAALYGQCAMLEAADPALLPQIGGELVTFARRLENAAGIG